MLRISILTTVTNPVERQDRWIEALQSYADLADEVIVVNGGKKIINIDNALSPKIRFVDLDWPFEWNWAEYPRHLNFGKQFCTGNWIIRLDIDQFIHEDDWDELKMKLKQVPVDCDVMTMQKMSFTYGNKYYQKGETEICVRNRPYIEFGEDVDNETDMCFPIHRTGTRVIYNEDGSVFYEIPRGRALKRHESGINYWNYDYYFRDMEVTRREFWRGSRAWNRLYKNWNFGDSEENAFKKFCGMIKARNEKGILAIPETHSRYIRKAAMEIVEDRLGFNGWGIL